MAQTQMITINRKPGQSLAEFSPPTLAAGVGDDIFWSNNDEQAAHWPAPINGNNDDWMNNPIPAKLPDQPAPTSRYLSFSGATTKPVTYVCALHPQETGTITVK
jgi:plastocyanin